MKLCTEHDPWHILTLDSYGLLWNCLVPMGLPYIYPILCYPILFYIFCSSLIILYIYNIYILYTDYTDRCMLTMPRYAQISQWNNQCHLTVKETASSSLFSAHNISGSRYKKEMRRWRDSDKKTMPKERQECQTMTVRMIIINDNHDDRDNDDDKVTQKSIPSIWG